jgi:hypothetical protein
MSPKSHDSPNVSQGDAPSRAFGDVTPAQAPLPVPKAGVSSRGPQGASATKSKDDPSPGAVFVRHCPKCGDLHQTVDPSGQKPCAVCVDLVAAPKQGPQAPTEPRGQEEPNR